jgi:ferredoxin-NADP reductase
MREEIKLEYVVKRKREEAPGVATLELTLTEWSLPAFVPGQYITVYFPESGTPEGKAYSISSAPCEHCVSITVRGIGEFSNRLVAAKPGDKITGSQPYGYFYSENADTPLVMIAAGIGITPFRSMIKESLVSNPSRKLFLIHSTRTLEDAVFKKELEIMAVKYPNLKVFHFVTREDAKAEGKNVFAERVTAAKVRELVGELPKAEYMLCGPISFTRDLWRGFRALDVPEEALYTEAFFSY